MRKQRGNSSLQRGLPGSLNSGFGARTAQDPDFALAARLDALAVDTVLLLDPLTLERIEDVLERLGMQDFEFGEFGLRLDARLGHFLACHVRQRGLVGAIDALGVEAFESQFIG